IEKTNDGPTAKRMAIITVERDGTRKTATLYDNDDSKNNLAGPLMQKFRAVERVVLGIMSGYTIQVTVEKSAAMPR
ncbi:MAG TPA: hypothetical protein VJU16_01075, partial [Planctomycetota bacterium]|nr:hypothetical protein [Planctomycetota bacterium]